MVQPIRQSRVNQLVSIAAALLIGIALFIIAYFGARHGQITGWELDTFKFFNHAADWVVAIFIAISFLGTVVALVLATAILMVLKRYGWAIKLFLAGGIAWATATFIKLLEIRARPYELLGDVHLAETKDFATGFPSAHAATAAAIALMLTVKDTKKISWLFFVAVLLVAISRMVVGMHAPLDVVGGIGIGMIVASLINGLSNLIAKRSTAKAELNNHHGQNQSQNH